MISGTRPTVNRTVRTVTLVVALATPLPLLAAEPSAPGGLEGLDAVIAAAEEPALGGDTAGEPAAAMAAEDDGMRPGVAKPPQEKHPFFFAAYAAVWAVLFGYLVWLSTRVRALEQKLRPSDGATDRSR